MTPEEFATRWQAAAQALLRSTWAEDAGWLSVLEDEALVGRPEADLLAAQARVRELACSRLAAMSVEVPATSGVREVLALLKTERPVQVLEVCARNRGRAMLVGLCGGVGVWLCVVASVLFATSRPGSGMTGPVLLEALLVCLILGVRLMLRWRAGRAEATEQAVRLTTTGAPTVLALDGLEVSVRSGPGLLRLTMRTSRHVVELEPASDPAPFIAHLLRRGVRCS